MKTPPAHPIARLIQLAAIGLLCACASDKAQRMLAERTQGYVFDKPVQDVWLAARAVLEERGFPGGEQSPGQYHLETATLTPDGKLPAAGSSSSTGGSSSAPPSSSDRQGGGGRGGGRRGGSGRGGDRSGGEVIRFVMDADAVDDVHCRIRIIRFSRDNVDSPESAGVEDGELEWKLISRLEPDKATVIRGELSDAGIELPR